MDALPVNEEANLARSAELDSFLVNVKEMWVLVEFVLESRYGLRWQAALVGLAVFVVPWALFFITLLNRARTKKHIMKQKTTDSTKAKVNSSQTEATNSEAGKNSSNQNNEMKPKTNDSKEDLRRGVDDTSLSVEEEDDANAAPFHYAVRIPDARLRGSQRNLSFNSRSSSRSSSRSRSRSSSPAQTRSKSSLLEKEISDRLSGSITSNVGMVLEEIPTNGEGPPDILTDRMGFEDIEPPTHDKHTSLHSSLPPVNERMSEETLDDCHAFSDVVSRNGSLLSKNRPILPSVNERISKEKLDDCDAFKHISVSERRSSVGRNNSFTTSGLDSADISCSNSLLETFEEGGEEEDDEDDDEGELTDDDDGDEVVLEESKKKQQLGCDVLFELLNTVTLPSEKEELKKIQDQTKRLSL